MGLAGVTGGRLRLPSLPHKKPKSLEAWYAGKISEEQIAEIRAQAKAGERTLHDALMDAAGWPPIVYDGQLLVSQQDALLLGGKVQAPADALDHVVFLQPLICEQCGEQTCIEICSGEALHPGEEGVPVFDREKCVHCGACLWNCSQEIAPGQKNLAFAAGPGGLHSAEN